MSERIKSLELENKELKEKIQRLEQENKRMLRLLDQIRLFFLEAENLRNLTREYHFRE